MVCGRWNESPACGIHCPDVRMVVDAQPGVEGQPAPDVLPEIDVAGHLVLRLVGDVGALALAVSPDVSVPRLASEAVVVRADGQPVAPEKPGALVPRYAHHVVP